MKKQKSNYLQFVISTAIFLLLPFFYQISFAQDQSLENNVKLIYESPAKLQLTYEKALNHYSSLSMSIQGYVLNRSASRVNFAFIIPLPTGVIHTKTFSKGYNFVGEYRFYFYTQQRYLNGLYFAPNAYWGKHNISYSETRNGPTSSQIINKASESIASHGFGLKLGYQKMWKRFNLDFGLNIRKSYVVGDKIGISLKDGYTKLFDNHINGWDNSFYIGVGIAF